MNYALDLTSIAAPALPLNLIVSSGTAVADNDGSVNRVKGTTSNTTNQVFFNVNSSPSTTTFTFEIEFASGSAPTLSYAYPGIMRAKDGSEYEIVLSRGLTEARGALWIQKFNFSDSSSTTLGGPTYLGVSATTFTGGIKYNVSVAVSGTSTVSMVVSIQRLSDNLWLQPTTATWGATQQACLTISDSSSPLTIAGYAAFNAYASVATDSYLYAFGFDNQAALSTAQQYISNPVLVKGGTYGGWKADAIAAPSETWDEVQYVTSVSLWSIANSQWASAFFTTADLKTWSYINGSLWVPTGGDYIVGNGSVVWFGGKYWFSYSHYANGAGTVPIAIAHSTDLLTWTVVADPLVSDGFDSYLTVNLINNLLELWYMHVVAGNRVIHMQDSPDGTTWTDRGDFLTTTPLGMSNQNLGTPAVFYYGTTRYLTFDCGFIDGYRVIVMEHSINRDTTWIIDGIIVVPNPNIAAESVSVFDSATILADLNDGVGLAPRLLYAMSDVASATDNTDSSIGLATLSYLAIPTFTSMSITGNQLTITGNAAGAPPFQGQGGLTFSATGGALTISGIINWNSTFSRGTATLSRTPVGSETITASYDSTVGNIENNNNVPLQSFSNFPVMVMGGGGGGGNRGGSIDMDLSLNL